MNDYETIKDVYRGESRTLAIYGIVTMIISLVVHISPYYANFFSSFGVTRDSLMGISSAFLVLGAIYGFRYSKLRN